MKLLLVEDNANLSANLTEYFTERGHEMEASADGISGLDLAKKRSFDVIVLDVMLPGMDGFEFCRQLREDARKNTPVIMLTAKDTEQDKLTGFGAGADDYLVKPFSMRELEARLLALLRRSNKMVVDTKLVVADLQFDLETMDISRGERAITLKPVPRRILELLMKKTPRVVTRDEIEHEIWHEDIPDREVLRVHIHAIRSAVDKHGEAPLLQTIHGVGYRLAQSEA